MSKKIFVTGGSGFIGSAIVKKFVHDGYAVTVLDNNSRGNLDKLNDVEGHFEFIEGDVRDEKNFKNLSGFDSIVHLASSLVIFTCIMLVLVWVNPTVMLISVFFFGTLYLLFVKIGKKEIYKSSQIIDEEQNNIVLSISDGLGSIRDIILDNTQKFYLKIFDKSNFNKAKREAITEFIQQSPRYIFESMGIVLFVVLLIYSSITINNTGEFSNIFPTLAALALGSQRILPLLNKLYTDFITIKSKSNQLDEIIKI